MVTYILFVLLYGGLLKSRIGHVVTAALMANTKVYMVSRYSRWYSSGNGARSSFVGLRRWQCTF